jgi:hypothetical protein
MSLKIMGFFIASALFVGNLYFVPLCSASTLPKVRLGYLEHPGSALCLIAESKGHYREDGLNVELVKFTDSSKGMAALETGKIDAGAFPASETLRAIARGKGFRIIAGGGTPLPDNPLAELDDTLKAETESWGIVVSLSPIWQDSKKEGIVKLAAALIRAYRTHLQTYTDPLTRGTRLDKTVHFDPNPDYWRLERIWRSLGLQDASMQRDFLANHVYEEIYCDALDRLLDDAADDAVFKDLFSRAVCTPNCCPTKETKSNRNQGGKKQ